MQFNNVSYVQLKLNCTEHLFILIISIYNEKQISYKSNKSTTKMHKNRLKLKLNDSQTITSKCKKTSKDIGHLQ